MYTHGKPLNITSVGSQVSGHQKRNSSNTNVCLIKDSLCRRYVLKIDGGVFLARSCGGMLDIIVQLCKLCMLMTFDEVLCPTASCSDSKLRVCMLVPRKQVYMV